MTLGEPGLIWLAMRHSVSLRCTVYSLPNALGLAATAGCSVGAGVGSAGIGLPVTAGACGSGCGAGRAMRPSVCAPACGAVTGVGASVCEGMKTGGTRTTVYS